MLQCHDDIYINATRGCYSDVKIALQIVATSSSDKYGCMGSERTVWLNSAETGHCDATEPFCFVCNDLKAVCKCIGVG